MLRVAVLGSGRGSNLHSLLRHAAAGTVEAEVTLVATDRPGSGCVDVARKAKVPAIAEIPARTADERAAHADRLRETLLAERPGLVVLAGYMRIVPDAVLEALGQAGIPVVNIHPSLLPAFRGLHAVRQALAAGVRVAGCTTHLVTPDLDAGAILLQAAVAVGEGETEEGLARRILAVEHLLLPRTVQLFAEGRVDWRAAPPAVRPGPTWLGDRRIDLVSGVLYGEGF